MTTNIRFNSISDGAGAKCVNSRKIGELRDALVAVSGILNWGFLSDGTRFQLEKFKEELVVELRFRLSQQAEAYDCGEEANGQVA